MINILLKLKNTVVCQKYLIQRDIKLPFVKDTLYRTYSRHRFALAIYLNSLSIPINMPTAINIDVSKENATQSSSLHATLRHSLTVMSYFNAIMLLFCQEKKEK